MRKLLPKAYGRLLLVMALLFSLQVHSQDVAIHFPDIYLTPGGTGEVTVSYTTTREDLHTFQMEFDLPDGLHLVDGRVADDVRNFCPEIELQFNDRREDNKTVIVIYDLFWALPNGTNNLMTLTFQADEMMSIDTYPITTSYLIFTSSDDSQGNVELGPQTFNINVIDDDDIIIEGIYYAINSDGTAEVICPPNNLVYSGHINLPSTISYKGKNIDVKKIGDGAFSNSNIESIIIPNSVTSIGEGAFSDCSMLTTITIPNSVTSIGCDAFIDCPNLPVYDNIRYADTYLIEIIDYTVKSAEIREDTRFIGDYAFGDCSKLTTINIPDGVMSIGEGAFYGCSALTSIDIPDGLTSIGNEAFAYCSGLTSIILPGSVASIGDEAFYRCIGLTSVTIHGSVTSIGEKAFGGCSNITTVTINSNTILSKTYSLSFSLNNVFGTKVEKFIIGEAVTSIGDYAFYNCSNVTSIDISNSVTSIGNMAFYDCTSLTSVIFGTGVKKIGSWAFSGCTGLTSVNIPNSVTSIRESAFSGCTNLTSVTIGKGVTSIGYYAFNNCINLQKVIVGDIDSWCRIIFDDASSNPVWYAHHLYSDDDTEITDLVIPEGITSINARAFIECVGLTTVTIPNSVQNIDFSAFSGCSSLISATIGNGVKSLQSRVFADCIRLQSVIVGSSVSSIDGLAFENCTGLTNVYINSDALLSKSNSTSSSLKNLFGTQVTNYDIGDSVEKIGDYAFYGCTALTSVTIGSSVTSIGNSAFGGCQELMSITSLINNPFTISKNVFDDIVYQNATLYIPYGTRDRYMISPSWSDFINIHENQGGGEGGTVQKTTLTRELSKIRLAVTYTGSFPSQWNDIVDFKSEEEALSLLNYSIDEKTVNLYFSTPRKGGKYTLTIQSEDIYTEDFVFEEDELYVIAQSPLTAFVGKEGFTDIIFNDCQFEIPISSISLMSPTSRTVTISSVNYIDTISPARYRITYQPLKEDGIYTLKIAKGLTSGNKTMLYDFETTIETPCANLVPQDLTVSDSNWKPDQLQSLTYTVFNNGSNSIEGDCVDIIYLSPTNEVNDGSIMVYRESSHINIDAQESLEKTVSLRVPTCIDGDYYLILKTNVRQDINETSFNDNLLVYDPITLSVDFLTDQNNKFSLERGEARLFRIPVDVQKTIEISDRYGIANMYTGYHSRPDRNNEGRNGSVFLYGANQATICYLLVENNNKIATTTQSCELDLREIDLEIAHVGRETVVKHKTAWIPIEVKGCTNVPNFYLMGEQGQRTDCKNVRVKNETSFLVEFDTKDIQPGIYNLYVECGDKSGVKQNAINIVNDLVKPELKVNLFLPEGYRVGADFTARINYENKGNVDIPIPLLILTGEEGSSYQLEGSGMTYTNEIHLLGLNIDNVKGSLMPGESGSINVIINRNNTSTTIANYVLKAVTEGCEGIDDPFYLQWLDVDPDNKPLCYSDDEWTAFCSRVRGNVGDTWMSFIQALETLANRYYSASNYDYDAHTLYNILRGIDLNDVTQASQKIKRNNAKPLQDVESGTLFIWKNGKWNQLVEAYYKDDVSIWNALTDGYLFVPEFAGWTRTDNISLVNFSASKNYIISHGWMDDRDGETKQIAEALSNIESDCNIFGIDWSQMSTSMFVDPLALMANGPATKIPEVANRVVQGFCTIFGTNRYNLRINNLYLIGHSHGAHLCGMIAHNLPFRPKRLTALDASQELSHLFTDFNFFGTGWGSSDVQFLDYYKSSIMAGTNLFKGHNNFILIEGDNGFKFDNYKTEEYRHGYSIRWFKESIINNTPKIGYNLTPNYLKDNWGEGFSESQYHGVINGSKNTIENFDIKKDSKWRYTKPWYGKKSYQFLFNDNIFQNAFARTIEYEPLSIDPYPDGKDHIKCGTTQHVKVSFKNNADNHTVPLNVRESEVRSCSYNALFIAYNNKVEKTDVALRSDGISEVKTSAPVYLLGVDDTYGNLDVSTNEMDIDFNIPSNLWDELAGMEKDKDYIYCDLWFIPGCDRSDYNTRLYGPTKNIKLWEGELYPENNYIIEKKVKIKNPTLSCKAGNDTTLICGKGQNSVMFHVNGVVEKDGGYDLSYQWEYKNRVFSNSKNGSLSLGVGKHRLTFRIKAKTNDESNLSDLEASDDVIIMVKSVPPPPPPSGNNGGYPPGNNGGYPSGNNGSSPYMDSQNTTPWKSCDPNEKIGYNGVGNHSNVRQGEMMEYSIYFENDAEKAQLAAQKVVVTDTLDAAFDLSTFEFTRSEVANTFIDVPLGKSDVTVYTDLRPNNNLVLKTEMKLDIDSRVVTVIYTSLDTLTMEPTRDMFSGFLPPNDSTHVGEGHFSYRVKLKDDLSDYYEVKNQAHIVFDYNEAISTNTTCHVLDNGIPISWIEALPSTATDSVLVSWNGKDDGSGIKYYDIYYSKNGGPFEIWQRHTTSNSAYLYGEAGDEFKLYSLATDFIGYVESDKIQAEDSVIFVNSSSIRGDVNGDGLVTVTDVAMMVAYILGEHNSGFIIANADMNNDGSITVTDVSETVAFILDSINHDHTIFTCPDDHHPHIIDLGLPSGTKWACCNVGADKPEAYGGYYAWGETEEKDYYYWDTYQHCDGSSTSCLNLGNDIAGTQYDVANVQWGGSWVMPSQDQIIELLNKSSYTWTSINDVNGGQFTGPNGKCIFLPAAGYRWHDSLFGVGSDGGYWCSTQSPSELSCAYFYDVHTGYAYWNDYHRCGGFMVRPIYLDAPLSALTLSISNVDVIEGANATVEITSGNGSYEVTSSNISVATVALSGTTITITGESAGTTEIIVKDKVSDNTQKISVTVYKKLTFSSSSVEVTEGESATVKITSGNGSYSVTSSNTSVAVASLSGTTITILGVAVGSAVVTVTDQFTGNSLDISVTVTKLLSYLTCPDDHHPHMIDLGLPSGTLWQCCNEGASKPEDFGGYYKFGEVSSAPSLDQIKELVSNCSYLWTTQNGVKGGKFTGPSGGSIFLPAAGYVWNGELYFVGSHGYYWSSTPYDGDDAYGLSFYSYGAYWDYKLYYFYRYYGLSVRPVR